MMRFFWTLLAGWPTPLKNDGVRQWEGWHPIYEMDNKNMFETTKQLIYRNIPEVDMTHVLQTYHNLPSGELT